MDHRTVEVKLPGREYQVLIGDGLIDGVGDLISEIMTPRRALLVSDTRVFAHWGERCKASLIDKGWRVTVALIPPGEGSKTLGHAAKIYDAAVDCGLDRYCPVIALGGGVVGDLAGFAASTYMRGVPYISFPTTLLAQVDSSVGGKVAVNHPGGKNLIGTFYQPALVAADTETLQTLPPRQLRAGVAEVIKYGIIKDKSFFEWLEQNLSKFMSRNPAALLEGVERSVRIKAAVVEQDEEERDLRRILNFGHTIGHALEAATGYRYYLHGEAVLAGMVAAAELSTRLGLLREEEAIRIKRLLGAVGLKKPPAGLAVEKVMEKLQLDKKRQGEELIFILPRAIGVVECLGVRERTLLQRVIANCL